MIRSSVFIVTFILFAIPHVRLAADDKVNWELKESAQKEIDGMRRYTWVVTDRISTAMKTADKNVYPNVHQFLRQSEAARAAIDPDKNPTEWPKLDLAKLLTNNPTFWAAYYEVAPGDTLLMWMHACLFGINGDVHRAKYAQAFTLRSSNGGLINAEIPRLAVSTTRIVSICNQQVRKGIKHHDAERYDQSEKIYRDVLSVCPSHSLALYELGYTLNNATRKAGKRDDSVSQPYYDKARAHDPFMVSAYQGSFTPDGFREMQKLRSSALPKWQAMMKQSSGKADIDTLEPLSQALQESGIHELALIARQTVVARRKLGYNDDDVKFISTSLSKLLPGKDLSSIKKSLIDKGVARLTIEFEKQE